MVFMARWTTGASSSGNWQEISRPARPQIKQVKTVHTTRALIRTSILASIMGLSLLLQACDDQQEQRHLQVANPASVYCGQAGGTSVIKNDSEGNQAGYCEFADGQQCDEWALFRGECVPDQALSEPFKWCAQGMNSPVMSGKDHELPLPAALVLPVVKAGITSTEMPITLLEASRWRCMSGHVWVCMVGANLPCSERADLTTQANANMSEFCQANPDAAAIPAYVTGRATVFEWTCKGDKAIAGKQIAEVDEAGYLSNIWYQIEQ